MTTLRVWMLGMAWSLAVILASGWRCDRKRDVAALLVYTVAWPYTLVLVVEQALRRWPARRSGE